ncbi:MAG: aspartate/glutamate racemase family protein [Candidatus Heimdallarchaeota archaeon]
MVKKIGIIGGLSPESTVEYYKIITRKYNEQKGKNAFPELTIESLDLQEFTDLMIANDLTKVLNFLLAAAESLMKSGAELIILATNTPHIVFNELAKKVKVPMLSIMEATGEAIKKQGLQKIGLIGTRFTMNSSYYQDALEKYDIEVITPTQEDKKIIDTIIYSELTYHILTDESRQRYLQVIERLQQKGAQGIILGCTEIPLLVKQEDCKIPVFDTTTIHALATLQRALKD